MNIFDLLIVQPIFNLLVVIYSLLPGSDFGISLIIFTVLVRFAMWPLVKKQLRQVKVQRALQPELKRIKQQAKGNKQLEGQLMLELYKEKGVSPFSSIGTIFLQLPIFIALYNVIQIITVHRDKIENFTYPFVSNLGPIHDIITSSSHYFNESLLGFMNLSKVALSNGQIYWPLMILAVLSAALQYYQSKQITPQPTEHKRLRDVMAASAEGKEVDQAEVSAIMSQRMLFIFPIMTFMIMLYLPGAIALYTVIGSIVAIIQQRIILNHDVDDMEASVATTGSKKSKNATVTRVFTQATTEEREKKAAEAEIVTTPKPRGKKRSKRR
jgi:YidC/Oxa1 family membrane protein insertase